MKVYMVLPGGGPYMLGGRYTFKVLLLYLPILLSTSASMLFWKICGVVEEEKLLLVITLSSGLFFFR